eukprot:10751148-Ditylum_brightwellii.AAC.1
MTDTSDDGAFMVMYGSNGGGHLYVLSHTFVLRGGNVAKESERNLKIECLMSQSLFPTLLK